VQCWGVAFRLAALSSLVVVNRSHRGGALLQSFLASSGYLVALPA
jgi:hypothetical protein